MVDYCPHEFLFTFHFNSTKYGMYEPNCGLENVMMSWGHDGKKSLFSVYVYRQFAWSSGKFAFEECFTQSMFKPNSLGEK